METVAIIGAGASGMAAALRASEAADRRVLLLERQQRPGRKLLSTGNGRCNLTNMRLGPEHYHGRQPGFVRPALEALPPEAARAFFRGLGLLTVEEPGGRVYPLSDSANSVLDVLRFALERRGVELLAPCPVRALAWDGSGFTLDTERGPLGADKVIVACGGAAGARLGGVADGYALLGSLGHRRTALTPALTPLTTGTEYPRALKGVRADGAVSLLRGGSLLAYGEGDIQFTDRGVSGPAVFDVSRAAALAGPGAELRLDFLRGLPLPELEALLRRRRESLPDLEAGQLFTGMVHNRLGRMLVKYAALPAAAPLASLGEGELRRAARACKGFALPLKGAEGFDSAQVTAGGVETAGFDPGTLESRLAPGLFACGEVLDIDGDCGGYNLHWAWASGLLAGRLGL